MSKSLLSSEPCPLSAWYYLDQHGMHEKMLGQLWNTFKDILTFNIDVPSSNLYENFRTFSGIFTFSWTLFENFQTFFTFFEKKFAFSWKKLRISEHFLALFDNVCIFLRKKSENFREKKRNFFSFSAIFSILVFPYSKIAQYFCGISP